MPLTQIRPVFGREPAPDTTSGVPSTYGPKVGLPVDGMEQAFADAARRRQQDFAPVQETEPVIAFSQSKNKMFVNGLEFDAKDAATALQSEQYIKGPRVELPEGDDWTPITAGEFGQYLNTIKNPDLGRLASKNFEIGMNNMGALWGAGMQFVGLEEPGSKMVAEATKNLGYLEPFQRHVENSDDLVEWFVANLAQQGPNLLESTAVALGGFVAGSAAAGPLGGAAEAMAGLSAKEGFKASIRQAAKDYITAKAAGDQVKMAAARKLLRPAAGMVGATAFTLADNYRTGVSDIYGELRGNGVGAGDGNARLAALGGAIPYAALETIPEAILGLKIAGKWKGSGGMLNRGAKGLMVGGTAEGLTEVGQEALLVETGKAFGNQYDDDEVLSRYINSFAAGFAVGGPIGGIANIAAGKPADLLQSVPTTGSTTPTAGLREGGSTYPAPPGSAPTEAELLAQGERSFSPAAYPVWPGPKPLINRSTGGKFGETGPFGAEVIDGRAPPNATPEFVGAVGENVPEAPAPVVPSGPLPTPPTGNFGDIGPFGTDPVAPNQTLPVQAPVAPPVPAQSAPQQTTVPSGQDILQSPDFKALQQEAAQQTVDLPDAINIAAQQSEQTADQQQLPMGQLKLQKRRNAPVSAGGLVTDSGLKGPEQLELPLDNSLKKSRARAASKAKVQATAAASAQPAEDKAAQENIDREHQNVLKEAQRRKAVAEADAAELKAQALKDKAKERIETMKAAAAKLKASGKPRSVMDETDAFSAKRKPEASPAPKTEEKTEAVPLSTAAKERARRAAAKQEGGSAVTPTPVNTPENKPDVLATIKKLQSVLRAGSWVDMKAVRKALPNMTTEELTAEMKRLTRSREINPTVNEDQGSLTAEDYAASVRIGVANINMVRANDATQSVQSPAVEVETKAPAKSLKRGAAAVAAGKQTGSAGADAVAAVPDTTAASAPTVSEPQKGPAPVTNAVGRWKVKEQELLDAINKGDGDNNLDQLEAIVADDGGIIDMAFFTQDSHTNLKAPKTDEDQRTIPQRASEFLKVLVGGEGIPGVASEAQRQVIYDAFVDMFRQATWRYATTKGQERAWYTFAKDPQHQLLGRLDSSRMKAIPEADKVLFPKDNSKVLNPSISEAKAKPETASDNIPVSAAPDKSKPTKALVEIISQVLSGNRQANGETRAEMRALFADADPAAPVGDRVMGGKPITVGMFFDETGLVKFKKLPSGKYVLSAAPTTKTLKTGETVKDPTVVSKAFRAPKAATPMSVGRVKLIASAFNAKLIVRPKVHVFTSIEDMRTNNKALYDEAANGRPIGELRGVEAGGLAFNGNVVLFSDHLQNEQQVKFVLAHESIGHYGFQSIMPQEQLNKALKEIYDRDPLIKVQADRYAFMHGVGVVEATEEVMADMAGTLDNSIVKRIWMHLKNALNKLGLKFGDELARHMIFQSRRYVRYGVVSVFGYDNYIQAMKDMAARRGQTRYSRAVDTAAIADQSISIGSISMGDAWKEMDRLGETLKSSAAGAKATVGRLLGHIETLGHKAQRSEGLGRIFEIFQKQGALAKALKTGYMEFTKLTRSLSVNGGPTPEQMAKADELLAYVALSKSQAMSDDDIKSGAELIINVNGKPVIDQVALENLILRAMPTVEEIRNGIELNLAGKKITYNIPDLTEDSPIWKVFVEQRNVVNRAAADELLYKYIGLVRQQEVSFRGLSKIEDTSKARLSNDDVKWLQEISDLYNKIYFANSTTEDGAFKLDRDQVQEADEFVSSILKALHDNYKDKSEVREWFKDQPASDSLAAKYTGREYDAARAYLKNFGKFNGDTFERVRTIEQDGQYKILNTIRSMALNTTQMRNAGYYAKGTILGNYVPFVRDGEYEVKIVATDVATGKPVELSQEFRGHLAYFRTSSKPDVDMLVREIDKTFGSNEYTILDKSGAEVKVKFHGQSQEAQKTSTLADTFDYDEFVRVMTRLNIDLKPEERYRIVQALAGQHSAARKNLERTGTPGWDPDIIKAVAAHAEMKAHTSAKNAYRFELTDILLDDNLWLGDRDHLNKLYKAIGDAKSPAQKFLAEQAYERYAYKFVHMAGSGSGPVNMLGKEKPKTPLGQGRRYQEDAKNLMRWYANSGNIAESTEDSLSGPIGSAAKLGVVLATLGGNIATAIVNTVSLATHTLPVLAFHNKNRGFGGGFGLTAVTEIVKAMRQMRHLETGHVADLEQMLRDGSYAKYGLTRDEAFFLLRQTKEGVLDAAQVNSLTGSARGGIRNRVAVRAIEGWMTPFSYTERLNRRTTALASYRLNKARSEQAGADMAEIYGDDLEVIQDSALFKALSDEAVTTVNQSQGDYAMYNRPPAARGNVAQYLFVYKQFLIISAEMLSSLPPAGRVSVLAGMFLLSGFKGLPFFDDIADIIDTLCQKFGITKKDIEDDLIRLSDEIIPGSGKIFQRGLLDAMIGSTVSTKMGLGDMIPLTGMGREGANFQQEIENFLGPVFTTAASIPQYVGGVGKVAAETVGLSDRTSDPVKALLRDSPLTAMRSVGDALSYAVDGRVTDTKGRVVMTGTDVPMVIARALGFFPGAVTSQNDMIRLSTHVADQSKAIKARYVTAYADAKIKGDTSKMTEVANDVREWNKVYKDTEFEISNFIKSADRSAKERGRSSAARYLKSAPENVRPEAEHMLAILGYDEELE